MKQKCKLFDSSSILNYSSKIWGYHKAPDMEVLHCKFLRRLLCVKKSTNTIGLYGELGRLPLTDEIRKISMFRYWIKLLNSNDQSITKRIYLMIKHDAENDKTYNEQHWAFQIKTQLNNLGLTKVDQDFMAITLQPIKQRIIDTYIQTRSTGLNSSRRLSTYRRFKINFTLETYLDNIPNKKHRIALSKFRLSSHTLEIERGRNTNVEREQNKRAQRALGRSPEEKVKGQGEAIILI